MAVKCVGRVMFYDENRKRNDGAVECVWTNL